MAAMYNKWTGFGNLVDTPVLSETHGGTAVANARIAINTRVSADKEKVCFIDIVLYGALAEIAAKYTDKGTQVFIEGRLDEDQWTTAEGQNRFKHFITVNDFKIITGWKTEEKDF